MEPRYDPFDGRGKLDKDDMAIYLRRVGRGLNCRLDVPILSLEDLKWAAKIFTELAEHLQQLAYKDERQDTLRIMAGRYAMEYAKSELHYRNDRKGVIKRITKERENPYRKLRMKALRSV